MVLHLPVSLARLVSCGSRSLRFAFQFVKRLKTFFEPLFRSTCFSPGQPKPISANNFQSTLASHLALSAGGSGSLSIGDLESTSRDHFFFRFSFHRIVRNPLASTTSNQLFRATWPCRPGGSSSLSGDNLGSIVRDHFFELLRKDSRELQQPFMETKGIEPSTPGLQSRCSPN